MRASIPDEVRRFILTSVPSVPYLEAMLLLKGEPGVPWDAAALARRLYLQPGRAADLLQQLADATFVAAERIDQLAHVYSENLLGVTELIHSRDDRRAQQFADAFRLRREDRGKEE